MYHSEINAMMAREQYRDQLRRAEPSSINRQWMPIRLSMLQYTARGLGHVLLKLSMGLVRYGRAEVTKFTSVQQSSIEAN